jgi:hypothetical protein
MTAVNFTEEIKHDIKEIEEKNPDLENFYKNAMLYFARKQTVFLYDIRHYLRQLGENKDAGPF